MPDDVQQLARFLGCELTAVAWSDNSKSSIILSFNGREVLFSAAPCGSTNSQVYLTFPPPIARQRGPSVTDLATKHARIREHFQRLRREEPNLMRQEIMGVISREHGASIDLVFRLLSDLE